MTTCHSELLAREARTGRKGKVNAISADFRCIAGCAVTDLVLELVDGELEARCD